jgi:hypothetical protein
MGRQIYYNDNISLLSNKVIDFNWREYLKFYSDNKGTYIPVIDAEAEIPYFKNTYDNKYYSVSGVISVPDQVKIFEIDGFNIISKINVDNKTDYIKEDLGNILRIAMHDNYDINQIIKINEVGDLSNERLYRRSENLNLLQFLLKYRYKGNDIMNAIENDKIYKEIFSGTLYNYYQFFSKLSGGRNIYAINNIYNQDFIKFLYNYVKNKSSSTSLSKLSDYNESFIWGVGVISSKNTIQFFRSKISDYKLIELIARPNKEGMNYLSFLAKGNYSLFIELIEIFDLTDDIILNSTNYSTLYYSILYHSYDIYIYIMKRIKDKNKIYDNIIKNYLLHTAVRANNIFAFNDLINLDKTKIIELSNIKYNGLLPHQIICNRYNKQESCISKSCLTKDVAKFYFQLNYDINTNLPIKLSDADREDLLLTIGFNLWGAIKCNIQYMFDIQLFRDPIRSESMKRYLKEKYNDESYEKLKSLGV